VEGPADEHEDEQLREEREDGHGRALGLEKVEVDQVKVDGEIVPMVLAHDVVEVRLLNELPSVPAQTFSVGCFGP